ncbi:hypothetical protein EV189_0792 [Motilibacter rhizosphaerae]|uniref:Uncharacterized protein n=1 Tax=Motilibacter rhizosphaerae TaxID=598652 RepID=A0A4Q7NX21_9ACTN|nr:hypothetical protein EV189_0792 [Motilibacter rhizosphaerae]
MLPLPPVDPRELRLALRAVARRADRWTLEQFTPPSARR